MNSALITIATSISVTFITAFVIFMCNSIKKGKIYITAIGNGVKVTLSDRIYQAHKYHIKNGYCTFSDLKHAEMLYEQYHNLGGNGSITKLVDDIRELPTHEKI